MEAESRTQDLQFRALSSIRTLQATYQIAKAAIGSHIEGDFVECGVFAGSQAAAMARAVMDSGERRLIHLFDSFKGIPLAGPHDTEFLAAKHPAGLSACSLEAVQAHMEEWRIDPSLLVYHPGWFEDTMPGDVGQIAVLRLDADLYEGTKVCMERLYPKLVPGGWCIVDDFALAGARNAVLEVVIPAPIYFQK